MPLAWICCLLAISTEWRIALIDPSIALQGSFHNQGLCELQPSLQKEYFWVELNILLVDAVSQQRWNFVKVVRQVQRLHLPYYFFIILIIALQSAYKLLDGFDLSSPRLPLLGEWDVVEVGFSQSNSLSIVIDIEIIRWSLALSLSLHYHI